MAPADPLSLVLGRYLLTGDEDAIEEVVEKTRPRLMAAARRIAGTADAEDAVQTAYLSLVRHRGSPLDAPVLPWLMTAVVRTAYRRRAVTRREARLADRLAMAPESSSTAPAGGSAIDADELARLAAGVARLPARYRDPVVLHHLHGLSIAEVARLLDLSEGGVRTRLHRARGLVRSRWSSRFAAAVLVWPWLVAERARDGACLAALSLGGVVNASAVGGISVLVLTAGVLLGRYVLAPTPSSTDEVVTKSQARVKELEDQVVRLEKEKQAARAELAAKEAATLAAAPKPAVVDVVPAMAAPAPTPPAATDAASTTTGPRLAIAGFEDLGKDIDWSTVGTSLSTMAPLMGTFGEEWAKTGKPPSALIGKISQHNGALVQAALQAAGKLKMEMGEANSAFTHPAFMANAIAAALESAKLPLSEPQAQALEKLGSQFSAEDSGRIARYDEKTWALQKLLDESDLRDRFFEAAFSILTPEQRAVLVAPAVKGRLQGDLFSSGLLWLAHAQVVPFATPEALATTIERGLVQHFELTDASRPAVHQAVLDWTAALPSDVTTVPADGMSLNGMVPVGRVLDAARRQMNLYQRIIDAAALDEPAAAKVRASGFAFVPLKTGG